MGSRYSITASLILYNNNNNNDKNNNNNNNVRSGDTGGDRSIKVDEYDAIFKITLRVSFTI